MKLFINKCETVVDGAESLADLLSLQNLTSPGIAVAVGNRVVRRADWQNFPLEEGMEITVISAVCGG